MAAILDVQGLSKKFGDLTAVDNVSFDVREGEIFSLLGPNGAGKTTTISMLCTLFAPSSGDAFIAGASISADRMAVRRLIGVVPQELALYDDLSGRENLAFWGRMYGMHGAALRARIEEVLSLIGLADRAAHRVKTYSGGMKRRVNIGVGLVTGSFFGGSFAGIGDIPVAVASEDRGAAGAALLQFFRSPDLEGLLRTNIAPDAAAARGLVDTDKAAAAVIVPAGFTASLSGTPSPLLVYTNPNRRAAAGVVLDVLTAYADRVQAMLLGAPAPAAITVLTTQGGNAGGRQGAAGGFNALAYIAPGMALMFLMYRVSNGGRSLLVERAQGTLPRLLVSPTSAAQVLGGKMIGIYATGVAQVLVLIIASTLLFRLHWGDTIGVVVLVLAAVAGATGWGLLLTALCRTPGQVSAIGAALMLIFGILGGSFVRIDAMPAWVRLASRITPNAWGLDAFSTLALGGSLPDIGTPLLALLVMAAVLFAVSTALLSRRGLARE